MRPQASQLVSQSISPSMTKLAKYILQFKRTTFIHIFSRLFQMYSHNPVRTIVILFVINQYSELNNYIRNCSYGLCAFLCLYQRTWWRGWGENTSIFVYRNCSWICICSQHLWIAEWDIKQTFTNMSLSNVLKYNWT